MITRRMFAAMFTGLLAKHKVDVIKPAESRWEDTLLGKLYFWAAPDAAIWLFPDQYDAMMHQVQCERLAINKTVEGYPVIFGRTIRCYGKWRGDSV